MKKPGLIINAIHRQAWEELTDENCGKLLKIIIRYFFDGKKPEGLSAEMKMAFNFLKPVMDNHKESYMETCRKNKDAANKRWGDARASKRMQTDADDANIN